MKTRLTILSSFLLAAWAFGQATVNFSIEDFTGTITDRPMTITAAQPMTKLASKLVVAPGPITLTTSGGFASTKLLPNDYYITIPGVSKRWKLSLYATNGTFNAMDLPNDAQTYYFTNGNAYLSGTLVVLGASAATPQVASAFSGTSFIADPGPSTGFFGSGLGLSNIQPPFVMMSLPIVKAETLNATVWAPSPDPMTWNYGVFGEFGNHLTVGNRIPHGLGLYNCAVSVTLQADPYQNGVNPLVNVYATNSGCLILWCWRTGTLGLQQYPTWVTALNTNGLTLTTTNTFANDYAPRALEIQIWANQAYAVLTNRVWVHDITILEF